MLWISLLLSGFHKHYFMTKKLKTVLLALFAIVCGANAYAGEAAENDSTTEVNYDWEPVMQAIIQVESGGDANAKSGNSCGAMQITPILVKECNNILRKRKSKKRFSLRDRFSIEKSKEMFLLIQSYFNPKNDIERAIRAWNGGNNFSMKRTQRYFEKVMSFVK